jgi:uncharacterized protein (TIGR02266 family)
VLERAALLERMADQQRRFRRKELQVDFRARHQSGAGQLLFESADLSAGGSFLKSDLLLEVGETLVVEFRLPDVAHTIRAQGRVAWVRRFPHAAEPAGMGLEFLAMSEEDREILEEFLGRL